MANHTNHTKRKVFSIAILVICLSIAGTGTYAYFTDSTTAHNIITTGKIDIELNDVITENLTVMPSTSVERPIIVTNDSSSNTAWVRVKIGKTIQKSDNQLGDAGLMTLQYQNGTYNSTHWDYNDEDEYYYYDKQLAPGKSTEPLFDTIAFSPSMGNEYQNSTAQVYIYAQATQVDHNGTSALTAQGWPTEAENN